MGAWMACLCTYHSFMDKIHKDFVKSTDRKIRLKSIEGQIRGIIHMLEEAKDPEQILNQFKAAQKGLDKAHYLLLDEAYRKALAIKIAQVVDSCPGNCGNEDKIEHIHRQFPYLKLDELTNHMREISEIEKRLASFNAEGNPAYKKD